MTKRVKNLPAIPQNQGYIPMPRDPHREACQAWDYLIETVAELQRGPVRRVLESERGHSYGLEASEILDRAYAVEYNARAFREALQSMIRAAR